MGLFDFAIDSKTGGSGGFSGGAGGKTSGFKKKQAAGGVLITSDGRIFLREPANHFDGVVWSFAKGGVDAGETLEQAALREVREEMGWEAHIIAPVPGSYEGGTSITHYFLMAPLRDLGRHDHETQTVVLADGFEEAKRLIEKTRNETAKSRDLLVLTAAYRLWRDTPQTLLLGGPEFPPAKGVAVKGRRR